MSEPTPRPWTPSTILHLALAADVDFAVLACNSHDEMVAALEAMRASFCKLLWQTIREQGRNDLKPSNQKEVIQADAALLKAKS